MAVALVLDFKGATLDQYDQIVEKMDPAARRRREASSTG
jgi:hypothetical protein